MPLTKRKTDKSANSNEESTNAVDGGDSLSTNAGYSSPAPRKSIRDTRPNAGESSYLLYKGTKSYMLLLLLKPLTWIIKLSIYYHHKKYLNVRLWTYFLIILIAGLLNDLLISTALLPKSTIDFIENNLKTSKKHFLNLYFVKIGWAWTLLPLFALIGFTRYYFVRRSIAKAEAEALRASRRKKSVHFREPLEEGQASTSKQYYDDAGDYVDYSTDDVKSTEELPKISFWNKFFWHLVPAIIRVIIATLIWYYSVESFVNISHNGASCRHPTNSTIVATVVDKTECKKQGYEWHLGFDISGHIFLMIFSTLIRSEELAFLLEKFVEFTEFRYLDYAKSRSINYASPYRFTLSAFDMFSLLILILMVVITFIWDFMILQTALFYHTLSQKLAGYAWAVFAWAVTYKLLFSALPVLRLQVAPHKVKVN